MIRTGNRLKTDLVVFCINFGVCFYLNTLVKQYDFFTIVLIFLIFALTSFGTGPIFRAFRRKNIREYRKYLYWFLQLNLIACTAHIFAYIFYTGQPNFLDSLRTITILGIVLLVLCYVLALVSVLILLKIQKKH